MFVLQLQIINTNNPVRLPRPTTGSAYALIPYISCCSDLVVPVVIVAIHQPSQPTSQKLLLKEKDKQQRRPACSVFPCRVVALENKRQRTGLWIHNRQNKNQKTGKKNECDRRQAVRGKAKLFTRRCVRCRRKPESDERFEEAKSLKSLRFPLACSNASVSFVCIRGCGFFFPTQDDREIGEVFVVCNR